MAKIRCEICGKWMFADAHAMKSICDDCEMRLLENTPYPYFS